MQRISIHIFCDAPECGANEIFWTDTRPDGNYCTVVPKGWTHTYLAPYPDEDEGEHVHRCPVCSDKRT